MDIEEYSKLSKQEQYEFLAKNIHVTGIIPKLIPHEEIDRFCEFYDMIYKKKYKLKLNIG